MKFSILECSTECSADAVKLGKEVVQTFDVLEVWGHIYKADYRMRLIYAQIKGSCALMGQEILEASDPY